MKILKTILIEGKATLEAKSPEPDMSLESILRRIGLNDLNRVLYRAHQEESGDPHHGGVYQLPVLGPFAFCGLQGAHSLALHTHIYLYLN